MSKTVPVLSIDDLPDILQARHIKQYLGISQAFTYVLMNIKGFPTARIGTRMIVPKQAFIEWLENSTGQKFSIKKDGE